MAVCRCRVFLSSTWLMMITSGAQWQVVRKPCLIRRTLTSSVRPFNPMTQNCRLKPVLRSFLKTRPFIQQVVQKKIQKICNSVDHQSQKRVLGWNSRKIAIQTHDESTALSAGSQSVRYLENMRSSNTNLLNTVSFSILRSEEWSSGMSNAME